MRARPLAAPLAALVAVCALAAAGCGGHVRQITSSTPVTTIAPGNRPLAEPPADQLPALMADLSVPTAERRITAADLAGAARATCAKGTAEALKAYIRARLPNAQVDAAGRIGHVVRLVDAQCPLTPGHYLELQSAVLVELALNGLRSAAGASIPEARLNAQACDVMASSGRSVDRIVAGLAAVAGGHRLDRRRALDIGVKAVVQACPVFIADLRPAIAQLRAG
jgi:hypothetical protein